MNKIIILLFALAIIASCKKSDENKNTGLIGKWKMTDVLMDPGDGSGTFQPISTSKYIEFRSNGTLYSNGSLVSNSGEVIVADSGTYDLADSSFSSYQIFIDLPYKMHFIQEGNILTISYPCIEPCRAKFRKM